MSAMHVCIAAVITATGITPAQVACELKQICQGKISNLLSDHLYYELIKVVDWVLSAWAGRLADEQVGKKE